MGMTNRLIAASIAITFIFALLGGATAKVITPCKDESASNCTWYADCQGNTQGETFTTIGSITIYWGK